VTTLSAESGSQVTVADALDVAERHLADVLDFGRRRTVNSAADLAGQLTRIG
jgi:hypothetical protein